LRLGLVTPTLVSKPAKHLDSAVNHLTNFIFLVAQEWSGAMAVSGFDLQMAPFVKHDNLTRKQIQQALQSMAFELNYPSRMGYQAPFSNITIVLDTIKSFLESEAIIGGKEVGKVGDYVDEAIMLTKELIKVYNIGDSIGSPLTFPIPTIMLTKRFDWNGTRWDGLTDMIFENMAKRGTFYLLNGYATNVEVLYSMCCRLTIDFSKLNGRYVPTCKILEETEDLTEFLSKKTSSRGMWAIPDATGSIGVITVNLPRIAFLSNGDEAKFNELLKKRLIEARETLKRMRERYKRSIKLGLMPMTKIYLGHFNSHYSTFGLVGLPEAAANFFRSPNLWLDLNMNDVKRAVNWMKNVVRTVRKIAEEWEKEDNVLYNVEEIPAASTAFRFAKIDTTRFLREVENGEFFIPTDNGTPFYSNSIIPYYALVPIAKRAELEAEVQQEFTGGVMMHLFLYESPDPKALKKLVHKIAMNTKIVYFSITPTIAVCKKCGWNSVGIHEECPKCKNKVELWSRIVGYYRPVSSWNVGKKAEFLKRIHYGNGNMISTKSVLKRV